MQLQWIRDLHEVLRTPWMDIFFKGWNYVDTLYFDIIVIAFVWYLWNKRIGARLLYALMMSLILNKLLKGAFHQPRPCQVDPSVGVVCCTSFGFPSGAAQTAVILVGCVFIECKRSLYRWFAVIFAAFLCFSRVYLGMHYPTDILGGLVVGGVLVLAYKKLFPLVEKMWRVAAIAFPFFLLVLGQFLPVSPTWIYYLFFVNLGVGVGLIMDKKSETKSMQLRIMQTLSVIFGLGVLFAAGFIFPAFQFLWDFSEGLWLSFLGARLIVDIKKFKNFGF